MKLALEHTHRRPPRIEMVPLLDTFFLLLAFFISSVLTMEVVQGLPVDLPKAHGSAPMEQKRLVVTLGSSGSLQVDGETVPLSVLSSQLKRHPSREELTVSIRGDGQIPYAWFIEVLDVIRQAQVGRVVLMTEDPPHARMQGKQ